MTVKEGFILKKILDDYIVVPTGDNIVDFAVAVSLNETGAFLWKQLESQKTFDELTNALAQEYELSTENVKADVEEFLDKLRENNFLVE